MKPKVAIVCDWLVSRGGAERVILAMSKMFPSAPIYTTIWNPKRLPEFSDKKVVTSFIQKMPFSFTKHYLYLPLMPYAFEQFDLSQFDIVLSSCHSCAKGIITKPQTMHVCYCHSPMRYVWDNCHEYIEQYGLPSILKSSAKRILHNLRIWDRLAAERVDFFIANSTHVKKRIWKYYRRDAGVIYPPVETAKFSGEDSKRNDGKYFLAVGRLAPYKRFDLLIETFNDLKLPLVIVGTGKEGKKLQSIAGRYVTLTGAVSDEQLKNLYQNAIALVFPQYEDFGITPLEAASAGKPVIAYGKGGALESVIPGKTGMLFMEQSQDALKKAILETQAMKWDAKEIKDHAAKFDRSAFEKNLQSFIQEKWGIWEKEMR